MPHMSSDQLRDISVAVVEDFVNNKTPLSVGLAKQASLHELNTEQIQRCVEASNTIAHLKLLSVSEDRTFEFPLCKFAEVMTHAATPDFEKSAGFVDRIKGVGRSVANTFKDVAGKGEAAKALGEAKGRLTAAGEDYQAAMGKVKSARSQAGTSPDGQSTKDALADARVAKAHMDRMGESHKKALEAEASARNLAGAKVSLGATGAVAAGVGGYAAVNSAGSGVEKQASDSTASKISEHEAKVLFIKEAHANNRAVEELELQSEMLKNSLVKAASEVAKDSYGLDKIACVVSGEDLAAITLLAYGEVKQVRDFGAGKAGLFKEAELKPVATLVDLYKEARALSQQLNERRALQKRAHSMMEGLQKEAILGRAVGAIGGGIGRAVGSVAGAGVKSVKAIGSAAVQTGGKLAGSEKYKNVGGVAAVATGGATLGLNASMLNHNPGVNPVNGRSRDVWEGLQST